VAGVGSVAKFRSRLIHSMVFSEENIEPRDGHESADDDERGY